MHNILRRKLIQKCIKSVVLRNILMTRKLQNLLALTAIMNPIKKNNKTNTQKPKTKKKKKKQKYNIYHS